MSGNDEIRLYVVKDKLSGARCTDAIPSRTEPLAIFGFMQFVETEVEKKKLPKKNYELIYVGSMLDSGEIIDVDNYRVVCDGEAAGELFEQLQQQIYDSEAL